MKSIFTTIALATLMATASPSLAGSVSWRATGTITSVDDPSGVLAYSLSIGDPFSFEVTINLATLDYYPEISRGFFIDPLNTMTLTAGGNSWTRIALASEVYLDQDLSDLRVAALTRYAARGVPDSEIGFNLYDDPIASAHLSGLPPDPAKFANAAFYWLESPNAIFGPRTAWISGDVRTLTAAPIPAAAWLLFSGVVGLGGAARHRRQHQM